MIRHSLSGAIKSFFTQHSIAEWENLFRNKIIITTLTIDCVLLCQRRSALWMNPCISTCLTPLSRTPDRDLPRSGRISWSWTHYQSATDWLAFLRSPVRCWDSSRLGYQTCSSAFLFDSSRQLKVDNLCG